MPGISFADLEGVVEQIDVVERRSGRLSAPLGKKVLITIAIGQAPFGLRPGQGVHVAITANEAERALVVPRAAVLHNGGVDRVAVKKEDGRVAWREVTLGAVNDEVAEIVQGIESGASVVANPAALMSDQERQKQFGPDETRRLPRGTGEAR